MKNPGYFSIITRMTIIAGVISTGLLSSLTAAFTTSRPFAQRPIARFISNHIPPASNHIHTAATTMSNSNNHLTNDTVEHVDADELPSWMLPERTRILNKSQKSCKINSSKTGGSIVYWMQRDVRTVDNWALLLASHFAETSGLPLRVLYTLPPPPKNARTSPDEDNLPPTLAEMPMTERHGSFLIGGLECVYQELKQQNVPLQVLLPESDETVGTTVDEWVANVDAQLVVCDMDPLRQFRGWHELQALPLFQKRKLPYIQVDAHNVVPVWHASPKREYGARTLRSKINKLIGEFTQEFPEFQGNQHLSQAQKDGLWKKHDKVFDRKRFEAYLQMDKKVPKCDWATPGTEGGMKQFQFFVEEGGLKKYDTKRNDPNEPEACSDMAYWLNFGHVGFQTLLLQVKKLNKYASGVASFVEEGVVRKELSDNFVYYTPNDYDTLEAAADWAKETLNAHTSDKREYVYSLEELQDGKSHDELWNAAQLQVVREGRMHGFLRMYWAKKILEWTETPEIALRTTQYLNDRFALDGKSKYSLLFSMAIFISLRCYLLLCHPPSTRIKIQTDLLVRIGVFLVSTIKVRLTNQERFWCLCMAKHL